MNRALILALVFPALLLAPEAASLRAGDAVTPKPSHQPGTEHDSVFPKTITPNGDGINDVVFFFFDNPTGEAVTGNIYDLRSRKVAETRESNLFAVSQSVQTWDGKDDGGAVVPAGVYLYKIEIGERVYTGTVGVAR